VLGTHLELLEQIRMDGAQSNKMRTKTEINLSEWGEMKTEGITE
jgi:hypothetical protein